MSAQFERLLEVLLPRGGKVMAIVEGYFDESGDLETAPGIFCISGYFIAEDAARAMHREWSAVLEAHSIPYFHMVDCAPTPPSGVFAGKDVAERSEIVRKFIEIIKKYTLEGFSIFAQADTYEGPKDAPDVYSQCAASCVHALQLFLRHQRLDGKIAYFFEKGHASKGRAYNHIARKLQRPGDSLTFAGKEEVALLQAADLLAWQSTKYAKDYLYPKKIWGTQPKRMPRKDFQSLMEHTHSFMHIDRGALNFELWPQSRRSLQDKHLRIDDSGPVAFWREEPSETPIFPVEKTTGWREGASRFAYVEFQSFDTKPYALSFDEARLFEAIWQLLQATSIFEGSRITPLFPVEAIGIDADDNGVFLRIKLPGAAVLTFYVPNEMYQRLKEALAKV